MKRVPCPRCEQNLRDGYKAEPRGLLTAEYLGSVRASIEFELSCGACGFGWTAKVPLAAFFRNPIPEAL